MIGTGLIGSTCFFSKKNSVLLLHAAGDELGQLHGASEQIGAAGTADETVEAMICK